jgi:UDP-glucose 4-epimerase
VKAVTKQAPDPSDRSDNDRPTILVTGGAGYIGSHVCAELLGEGFGVVVLDDFSNARPDVPARLKRLGGRPIRWFIGDIRDRKLMARIFARHRFAGVIHLAALKSIPHSLARPLDYADVNLGGLVALLQAMQDAEVHRLVFSSSAAVYGEPASVPISENAPLSFANPYAHTKLVGEQLLQQLAAADSRWAIGILRYFNPIGAHPSGLIGENPAGLPDNLMPTLARVASGRQNALQVFGADFATRDGTAVRDYIHVADLARGHVLSLRSLQETGSGHVVNLGSGHGYTVLEVLRAYAAACGRPVPFTMSARRPGDAGASYADPSRAQRLLGFQTSYCLADMCRSSWDWARSLEAESWDAKERKSRDDDTIPVVRDSGIQATRAARTPSATVRQA